MANNNEATVITPAEYRMKMQVEVSTYTTIGGSVERQLGDLDQKLETADKGKKAALNAQRALLEQQRDEYAMRASIADEFLTLFDSVEFSEAS